MLSSQELFEPAKEKRKIKAMKLNGNIALDGVVDEMSWKFNEEGSGFVQKDPFQGTPAKHQTNVSLLFDHKNLYIGAICYLENGKDDIKVTDLKRDFVLGTCDAFGISIDTFKDQRNCQVFEVNPLGVISDRLVSDGATNNQDWNGLWKAKTSIDNNAWYVEIEIPWSTLRFPKNSDGSWGINFHRLSRYDNEFSMWSAVPRALEVTQMQYAGLLEGIETPSSNLNMAVQPYLLVKSESISNELGNTAVEIGGEMKWAISPNTIVDLTINTDFAQADVDRKVVNLSRFSVFFPERRQFFLENTDLFSAGRKRQIEPFFSRSIGLDDTGNPIPLDFGIRMTRRDLKENFGVLLVRQRESNGIPSATFAVGSYTKNIGKLSRTGIMVTSRSDNALDSIGRSHNYTGTLSGFFNLSKELSYEYMVSRSGTSGEVGNGFATTSRFLYRSNSVFSFLNFDYVDNDYSPKAGFLGRSDYYSINPGIIYIYRGKLLPKTIRSFEPALFYEHIRQSHNNALLESVLSIYPIFATFDNGATVSFLISPSIQSLKTPFEPLGIIIDPDRYNFNRYSIEYVSNRSAKLSGSLGHTWGGFYNGKLSTSVFELTYAPMPHAYMSINYQLNRAKSLGILEGGKVRHLISPEIGLSLNPRLQLTTFYQRQFDGSKDKMGLNAVDNLNFRLAWEFKPLSFLYLIFNNGNEDPLDSGNSGGLIGKLTYVKQF